MPTKRSVKGNSKTSKGGRTARATSRSRSPASGRREISTIDDYLATVSGDKRTALDRLRKMIRSIVPRAKECISSRMPAFRLDGTVIA
ncbi:MAG TPA: hypothetical protein VGY54_13210, partial [Polyangiaceae bacterium]|nr:hypothetical protein [Polyangiaceae bacterium]